MIIEPSIEKLEYRKVLNFISNYSVTDLGKESILNLTPYGNKSSAVEEGNFVTEAKEILINSEYPPINYLPDLGEDLSRSRIEGTILRKDSIMKILELAMISRKLYSFLNSQAGDSNLLSEFSQNFFIDKNFEAHLSNVFNQAGDVKDNASRKLKDIRNEIIKRSANLKSVIEKLLKGFSISYLVQEEYVTQRDGRLVLPVKAEHKRHVKGFIHSESNTGQTVYIEPEETLELNNEILSLKFAEKREIEKILKDLTDLIGKNSYQLRAALDSVTHLDIIFAKAKYSLETIIV